MSQEGGDKKSKSNIDEFIKKYNISLNNNSVIRTSYYKYFHPKEAFINNGVLHEDFLRSISNEEKKERKNKMYLAARIDKDDDIEDENLTGFNFVYPFGGTLSVLKPSIPVLTSGSVCYPVNEALMALYRSKKNGHLFVIGSWKIFSDEYVDKDENIKIFNFILNNLNKDEKCRFEPDIDEKSLKKYSVKKITPNIENMSEKLKNAIQESEDISGRFFNMYNQNLFKMSFNLLPEALQLYDKLQVKHETIGLIPPIFETPMLGLTPSVFPPILVELEPPRLELYDLDDEFANQEIKLAQLTNKSTNKDLEYFITESANILGLKNKVNTNNPHEVLLYVLNSVMKCKMSSV